MDKFLELLKKIEAGESLTQQELESLVSLRQEIESGDVDVSKDSPFTSSDDFIQSYSKIMSDLANSPEYKAKLEKMAKDVKAKEVTGKVAQGLDLLLSGSDLMTSLGQIRQSDEGLDVLTKPGLPSAPRRNPLLGQQLRQAQRNVYDQSSTLAPAQAAIGDQYLRDLNAAQTASTGQASAFGSLAQVAANRRNRANLGLAQVAQQGADTARSRLDSLMGMRQDEIQNDFRNRLYLGKTNLDQYNTESQALGALGAAGRQNLRTSLGKIGSSLAPIVGQAASRFNSNPIQTGEAVGSGPIPYTNQTTGFGPEIDNYANKVESNLFGRFRSPYANQSKY